MKQAQLRPDPCAGREDRTFLPAVLFPPTFFLLPIRPAQFPGRCDGLVPLAFPPSFPSAAGVGREAGRQLSIALVLREG